MIVRMIWMSSLACTSALLLSSCARSPTRVGALIINPYDFTSSDLESATQALASARTADSILAAVGNPKANLYRFKLADTLGNHEQWAAAAALLVTLRLALIREDYRIVGSLIPSPEQIATGLTYWQSEREKVITEVIPFWQTQQNLAERLQDETWIGFCREMTGLGLLRVELSDSTIAGLEKDLILISDSSAENPSDILQRKISLEDVKIGYCFRQIDATVRAVELTVPDFSALGAFLSSLETIEQQMSHSQTEIDEIDSVAIPYWEGQYAAANGAGNVYWIEFIETMRSMVVIELDLARMTLTNLRADSALVVEVSGETPSDIKKRKRALVAAQINYYGLLREAISEGMSLGVLVEP